MKKFFKRLFGKAEAENETYREPQANNTPEMEKFADRVRFGNYAEVHRMLKEGFDPNQKYEYIDAYSYDNGAIVGTEVVRDHIMDVIRDEAMQKLLRAFGAKSSQELADEARKVREAAEKAAEELEKAKNMKIVDELLAQ